jgi:hypothetical protein
MCPERERCLITTIAAEPEPLPKEDEIEELEQELYLQHCADSAEQKTPIGSDPNPLLDMDD